MTDNQITSVTLDEIAAVATRINYEDFTQVDALLTAASALDASAPRDALMAACQMSQAYQIFAMRQIQQEQYALKALGQDQFALYLGAS
jgi:hypothetical protein